MQTAVELIISIGSFYFFIAAGYALARFIKGVEINKHLTDVLIYILIPILVFYALLTTSVNTIIELPVILVLAFLCQILGTTIMYIRVRKSTLDSATRGTLLICATFNNALFIPLPLILMFLGPEAVFVAAFFSVVQMLLLVSLGSVIGSAYSKTNIGLRDVVRKALLFPPLLAAIVALCFYAFGATIPQEYSPFFTVNGTITTYLALISVGLSLGQRFSLGNVRPALEVISVRQLIVPIIIISLAFLFGLSEVTRSAVIIEALMPPAILTVVYASGFNLDAETAATTVTIGTLFLLPVIPILSLFL
ncbi:MAG: AEC family transporter [Candidatus Thorarchaeota archaeon]